ncbi:hypothetical protein [Nocardia sp. IFM 10818]
MVTKRSVLGVAERVSSALSAAVPSRQSAAARIGVSAATLHRRLTGRRALLVEDVIATSLVADVEPSTLLTGEARQ